MANIYAPGHATRNPYSEQGNRWARGAATRNARRYGGYGTSGYGMPGTPSAGARGGGGGRAGRFRGLGGAYQDALNRANAANERRYTDLLNRSGGLARRNRARVNQMGRQERRNINEAFQSLHTKQQSDLTNRGLSGTSIGSGVAAGTQRRRSDAHGELQERLLRNAVATDSADTERTMGVIERRTDEGPDVNQLIALQNQLGQGSGGGGGMRGPMIMGGGYGMGGSGMHFNRYGGVGFGGFRHNVRMRPRNLNSQRYGGTGSGSSRGGWFGGGPTATNRNMQSNPLRSAGYWGGSGFTR